MSAFNTIQYIICGIKFKQWDTSGALIKHMNAMPDIVRNAFERILLLVGLQLNFNKYANNDNNNDDTNDIDNNDIPSLTICDIQAMLNSTNHFISTSKNPAENSIQQNLAANASTNLISSKATTFGNITDYDNSNNNRISNSDNSSGNINLNKERDLPSSSIDGDNSINTNDIDDKEMNKTATNQRNARRLSLQDGR
jgi:hypothetical protein